MSEPVTKSVAQEQVFAEITVLCVKGRGRSTVWSNQK